MKFKDPPKVNDEIKLGFILKKIISKTQKNTGRKIYYLALQKGDEKRLLQYNPKTMETSSSFERYSSSFGGSSKGNFKTWE